MNGFYTLIMHRRKHSKALLDLGLKAQVESLSIGLMDELLATNYNVNIKKDLVNTVFVGHGDNTEGCDLALTLLRMRTSTQCYCIVVIIVGNDEEDALLVEREGREMVHFGTKAYENDSTISLGHYITKVYVGVDTPQNEIIVKKIDEDMAVLSRKCVRSVT